MRIFLYHKETHSLRQKPTMEEPLEVFYHPGSPEYNYQMRLWGSYNNHMASLIKYPCAPDTVWEEGKEYVEGMDFEAYECNCKIDQDCPFIPGKWLTSCKIAHPLIKKISTDAEIEQMWKDADRELKEKPLVHGIMFTLEDMLECWEAGRIRGRDEIEGNKWGAESIEADVKQYFKTKFNIDL